MQRSGGVWRQHSFDITDPRLGGDVAIFANRVTYDGVAREDHISAASDVTVFNETWRVENDDGAWQGEPVVALDFPGPWTLLTRLEHR